MRFMGGGGGIRSVSVAFRMRACELDKSAMMEFSVVRESLCRLAGRS